MKKYLMTGMAAVALCGAFTSCSRESDFGAQTPQQSIQETYETAFKTRFGDPAPEQNWGFGPSVAASRAMTRGHNANANEWADPDKDHGGWVVPDPLDEKQKLRVKAYFQYNQYPGGIDCDYTDFFVQQVYKGNPSTKGPYSDEQYQSANNGWVVGSDHMDHLTAGSIHDHINNFNFGTYSGGGTVNVLDNGQHVGGTSHPDQIMLMVNSQTDCFGYWNSNGTVGHDDRYRLVSAEIIDDWIEKHADLGFGPDYGMKVVDDWNRSFIGFDFDQVVGEDVYAKNDVWENGQLKSSEIAYAKYSEAPETPQYIWDGENVIPINSVESIADLDITSDFKDFWNGSESKTDNSDGSIVYHAKSWGGLQAGYWTNKDFSGYTSIVVEFQKPTTVATKLIIETGDANGKWSDYYVYSEAGIDHLEINFAEKNINSWTLKNNIRQIALQAGSDVDLGIKRIYLKGTAGVAGAGEYMYYNGEQVPYLTSDQNTYCGDFQEYTSDDDVKIRKQYNGTEVVCLNWKKLVDERLSQDYLPVSGGYMKKWVKVGGGADGYYSDWIVTICKAKSQDDEDENQPDTRTETESLRVIAEDLSVGENTDFDFNDVVFDVVWTKNYTDDQLTSQNVKVVLQAAGGTLPLYVAGHEVHEEYGEDTNVMINTKAAEQGYRGNDNAGTREIPLTTDDWSGSNIYDIANSIDIYVIKNETECHLSAPVGGIASKIGVKTNYKWCKERQDIEDKYSLEDGTSPFREWVNGIYPANDWYGYAKNEIVKYRAAKAALNGE